MKKKATLKETIIYKFYSSLGHSFRILLNGFAFRPLDIKKPVSDLNLLFFSGKKGARMLKPVLLSIYKRWGSVPRVTVITDGTPVEYIAGFMKFWPFPYEIKSWEESAAYHLKKGRADLVQYASDDMFGRKLVSILAEAELKPTLYCDTDVLWFAEPRLPEAVPGKLIFRMSTDNVHSYNQHLLDALNRQDLMTASPLNSGVIFISGSVYGHNGYFEKIAAALNDCKGIFEEQTALAMMVRDFGDTWSLDEIMISTEDIHWPLIPDYFYEYRHKLFARHHVLTKNSWFWRDALYAYLCRRKIQTHHKLTSLPHEVRQNVQ